MAWRTAVQCQSCVNVGEPVPFEHTGPKVTGIFKSRKRARARQPTGLAGDAICDRAHHGGRDQAVYLYGQPDYEFWSAELGRALPPGTFGENLTVADLCSADVCIGDRFLLRQPGP